MKNDEVEKIFDRLVTPQEILDPFLFDCEEKLLPEAREKLLDFANQVVEAVFAPIKGFQVSDICLTGSMAGYFYREQSDIDMGIEIHNKSCLFLSKDPQAFDRFLNVLSNNYQRKAEIQKYHGRIIDIKTSLMANDAMCLYSVLNNKWRIRPNRNMYSKISKNEVLDLYYAQKARIEADIETFRATLHGRDLADRLDAYYREKFISYKDVKDYLVFKLLVKTEVIRSLGISGIQEYNKAYSLQ